jgi:hypothetical protein
MENEFPRPPEIPMDPLPEQPAPPLIPDDPLKPQGSGREH